MSIKVRSSVSVQVTLSMDLFDARWLQSVLQNPLDGSTPDTEYPEERERRLNFFNALKDQTENHA